jgi:hypothetical protein
MNKGRTSKAETDLKKRPRTLHKKPADAAFEHAVELIDAVCTITGSPDLLAHPDRKLLQSAIREHDTSYLFDWLAHAFQLQGISDAAALSYIENHGRIRWQDVERVVTGVKPCPKLWTYWTFRGCGYEKNSSSCSEPKLFARCSLPKLDLRNGRLNMMVVSLFLFIRDVAGGDLVDWIDERLRMAKQGSRRDRLNRMRNALFEPLEDVFSLGRKILSMVLSDLLLAASDDRSAWKEAGASMISIDTLVHNFLHRTGVLRRFDAAHAYGAGCYSNGCAAIIERASRQIDARRCNPEYPKQFARWVQHAVWQYCAADALNICNGNQIDDNGRCGNAGCLLFEICDRVRLHPRPREPLTRLA